LNPTVRKQLHHDYELALAQERARRDVPADAAGAESTGLVWPHIRTSSSAADCWYLHEKVTHKSVAGKLYIDCIGYHTRKLLQSLLSHTFTSHLLFLLLLLLLLFKN
jgi:hypothetical protein